MKLATFAPSKGARPRVGALLSYGIASLPEAYAEVFKAEAPNWFYDLKSLLSGGEPALKLVEEVLSSVSKDSRSIYDPENVTYLPPILNPGKVLCLGLNYYSHIKELGARVPERPYVFTKFATSLVGHKSPIVIPRTSRAADYEVELGVVIGKKGKYVCKKDAIDIVAGYTVVNDVTFRDLVATGHELLGLNWLHGKGPDSSTPVGPYLVVGEIEDPHSLSLTLRVNGEVRQSSSTSEMVFSIWEVIEYITRGVTLEPGDVISTGTPAGIGHKRGVYLKEGDLIEAEVERVGVLINPVVEEK